MTGNKYAVDESMAILPDVHSPLTDFDYFDQMLAYCKQHKIKYACWAGDLFNGDAVSDYSPKQANAGLMPEITVTRELIARASKVFKHQWLIRGNHDNRFVRKLGYTASFAEIVGTLLLPGVDNFTVFNEDYMWHPWSRGDIYICHPTSYSRIPLSNVRKIADKTRSHVVAGHCHHSAIGFHPDGTSILVEGGGFFDIDATDYVGQTSTFPTWVNGFVTIEKDRLLLHTKSGAGGIV